VQRGGGDESPEQSLRRPGELGRLLAAAEGYRVVASDGTHLGLLDHVRYERHVDHPDEIVVRRRRFFPKRRRALPFSAVEAVRPRERTVVVRLDRRALERTAVSLTDRGVGSTASRTVRAADAERMQWDEPAHGRPSVGGHSSPPAAGPRSVTTPHP
jgi:hypothetical protein